RAAHTPADQADGGSVGGGRPPRQQQRPESGAEARAEREPRQGQHAHDEAPPEAERGQEAREHDDDPVEPGHLAPSPWARSRIVGSASIQACSSVRGRVRSQWGPAVSPAPDARPGDSSSGERGPARGRRLRRARPVIALAWAAFALGAIVGASRGPSPAQALAGSFVAAWARGDYRTMYSDIDAAGKRTTTEAQFASAYERALTIAT